MDEQTFLALELMKNLPIEKVKEINLIMLGMQVSNFSSPMVVTYLNRCSDEKKELENEREVS